MSLISAAEFCFPSPPPHSTFCFLFFCASRMRATRLDMRALSDVPFHLYLLESHSVRGKGLFRFWSLSEIQKNLIFVMHIYFFFALTFLFIYIFLGLYISTAIGDSQNERHFSPRTSYVSAAERSFCSLFKSKASMMMLPVLIAFKCIPVMFRLYYY